MQPLEFKQSRKDAGFKTQKAFAEFLGVSPSAVKKWESGNRPVPRYALLAIERQLAESMSN